MNEVNEELTSFGVENPATLMGALYASCQDAIIKVIEASSAPETRKQLRTWGINDVVNITGKSNTFIRSLEDKDEITSFKDASGRKQYTLETINKIRDIAGTRFKRGEKTEPIICSTVNFKGGVGKSMTTLLLLQYLALEGVKVLGIDLDPQATLTTWFGFVPDVDLNSDDTLATTLCENHLDIKRVIKKTYFAGIDIIPANLELQSAELRLQSLTDDKIRELGSPMKRLELALEQIKDNYDVILIDCPPNTGILTINAICAVNSIIITLPPSMPDFASFVRLTKTLERIFNAIKTKKLDFFRVLLTKHKGSAKIELNAATAKVEPKRSSAANKLDQTMRKLFGEYMLVNHMVDSSEIDNTANAFLSIYEKPFSKNNTTYRRALEACNKVNAEIFEAFCEIWGSQNQKDGGSN